MPEPNAPDPAVDKLIAALDAAAKRAVDSARLTAPPAPAPTYAPAPIDPAIEAAREAELADLEADFNKGEGRKALKKIQDRTLGPISDNIKQLARANAESNVQRLRDRFGEKFTKREALFRAHQREYGVADEQLADPKILDQLWKVTYSNDPTYVEEEVDARLKAADDERLRKAAEAPPPSLSPITDLISVPDDIKEQAKSHFSEDAAARSWEIAQLASYGISPEQFIRQSRKNNDPEYTTSVGAGPYAKKLWTEIGDHKLATAKGGK